MNAFFKEYRDTLIAFIAIILASASLGFTIWQGKQEIKHNHVSVEPRINAYFSNDGRKNMWGIYIINNGMGTAFVKNLTVRVNGEPVDAVEGNVFVGAVKALGLNAGCFIIGGPRPNDSFKVGEEIFLIEARDFDAKCSGDLITLRLASMNPKRFDFVLDTESIYGDKFRYVFSQNHQSRMR